MTFSFLEPEIIDVAALTVAGLSVRTNNATEQNLFNPNLAKIPGLWSNFMTQNVYGQLAQGVNTVVYGVYTDFSSDVNDEYTLIAGVNVLDDFSSDHFTLTQIIAGRYLVFRASGMRPQVVVNTWAAIWQYFNMNPNIKRSYQTDFEKYVGNDGIEIYIGINTEVN